MSNMVLRQTLGHGSYQEGEVWSGGTQPMLHVVMPRVKTLVHTDGGPPGIPPKAVIVCWPPQTHHNSYKNTYF